MQRRPMAVDSKNETRQVGAPMPMPMIRDGEDAKITVHLKGIIDVEEREAKSKMEKSGKKKKTNGIYRSCCSCSYGRRSIIDLPMTRLAGAACRDLLSVKKKIRDKRPDAAISLRA